MKFVKYVMHQPISGLTGSPLISLGPTVLPSSAFSTGRQASVGRDEVVVVGEHALQRVEHLRADVVLVATTSCAESAAPTSIQCR